MTTATEERERSSYAVGERVTITRATYTDEGPLKATVTQGWDGYYGPTVRLDEGQTSYYTWGERQWTVEPRDTISPLTEDSPTPTPTEEGSVSREEFERVSANLATVTARVATILRDVAVLGNGLAEAADDNELCEQYERAVRSIAPNLSDAEVRTTWEESAQRSREFEVCVHVSSTTTVTVTARSEDEAVEQVSEDPWEYISAYELRDNAEVDEVHID